MKCDLVWGSLVISVTVHKPFVHGCYILKDPHTIYIHILYVKYMSCLLQLFSAFVVILKYSSLIFIQNVWRLVAALKPFSQTGPSFWGFGGWCSNFLGSWVVSGSGLVRGFSCSLADPLIPVWLQTEPLRLGQEPRRGTDWSGHFTQLSVDNADISKKLLISLLDSVQSIHKVYTQCEQQNVHMWISNADSPLCLEICLNICFS